MSVAVFEIRVDDFLARKAKEIIKRGSFKDEDAFFKVSIEEMVRW